MNDIQEHLLKKVSAAAETYRASHRAAAASVVDSVLDRFHRGMTREQIIDDLAAELHRSGPVR